MDPRTNFEDSNTTTARAFVALFREKGELFNFGIDNRQTDSLEEVEARLQSNDSRYDSTTIVIKSINNKSAFDELKEYVQSMGLEILEEEIKENQYDEEVGEYNGYLLTAKAPEDLTVEWDVPHLVVYGSLSPELETAYKAEFGGNENIEVANIRNHYVLYGEDVDESTRTELTTSIQNERSIQHEMQEDYVMYSRTSDLV